MDAIEAKVLSWLTEGRDDAADIVDLPWQVEELEMGMYYAEHPSVPLKLLVMFSENFVHLVVPTSVSTVDLDDEERLKVYEILLSLNDRVRMMKFSIGGEDGQVRLRVDLDKSSLGKEEFNDALSSLVVGVLVGVFALGLEDEFVQKVLERIVLMLVERIQEGQSEEELMKFLTEKVGMDVRDARNLLDEVLNAMQEE